MNSILPFSGGVFFGFIALSILLLWGCKHFFSSRIPYRFAVHSISTFYILFLYPKPVHLIGLIIILYLVYRVLIRYYRYENLIFPMLLLALPLILMKSFSVIPFDFSKLLGIIQITGISYLTFKTIGMYIDERNSQTSVRFIDYYGFIAFVPTLLIGPIDRYKRFTENVNLGYQTIDSEMIMSGLDKIIKGLLYKFIIAEIISTYILEELVMDNSLKYHFLYMYGYLFYLFFDFAGYSLLAVGYGNLLGIKVPMNFDKPFLSKNPKEFWKRWHITLGDWLGDYFFKPLLKYFTKKNKFGRLERQNVALFLTFLLMGFWNGFELHYILSGALFGVYSVVHNSYEYKCKKKKKEMFFGKMSPSAIKIVSIFIMINAVAFSIYIFSGKII